MGKDIIQNSELRMSFIKQSGVEGKKRTRVSIRERVFESELESEWGRGGGNS